jgi:hypothetical protein|tara:strand:- start:1013 stop:1633 length:621 start_codon:yes stop_codon:yes gene_type:complete
MADRAQGAVSFTPVVTIAAGSDADADAIDVIQHNINGALGGDLTFTVQDADDNWFYAPNVIVTTTSDELFGASDNNTDLVGASGDQSNGPNEAAGAAVTFTDDSTADCDADKVWFLFVKNTGTSDTSNTTTTNSVYISLDNSAAAYNALDNIEIKAGEAWMGNIAGPLMASIFIITGQARGAGAAATVNSSTSVRCTVAAIIEDVA